MIEDCGRTKVPFGTVSKEWIHEYARRQAYAKRKKPNVVIKDEDGYLDPQTGKAEWENEFDREEIYDNPFGTNND